jgi:hypothetical protein
VKIKSQKNTWNFEFNRESIFRALKIKPFLLFFTSIIAVSLFSLMLIWYGAVLQKNQTMATMQQLVFNGVETKFSVFSNYLSGFLSSPDRIYIDVDFEGMQLLNFARESALSKGIITDEEQEVSVKAKLSVGSRAYKVRLSPTGQNLDMIGSIKKRAYKVKVMDGKKIYGMEEFKLLPPISRHHIVEWIGHALENKEGLIALRYFFIETTLNGDDLGVYAVEEHFNKELLENRKAREGIIFSAKPNQLKIFNEKKISKDPNKRNQVRLLKTALQSVKNNEIDIARIFDLNKFASHFAIVDLMDGYHAVGDNSFYYFNPVTSLIEPIAREYNSLRYSGGQPNVSELMIEMYQGDGDDWAFANKLFKNKEFISKYISQLLKLSDPKYLDDFFEEIDEDLSIQKKILYRDNPFYKFPKEYMYERQIQIIGWLNQDLNIIANIYEDHDALFNVKVKNNSLFPIELIKFFSPNHAFELHSNNIIFPGKNISLSIELEPNMSVNDLNFSYKIYGNNNLLREEIVVPKSFISGVSLPNLWNISNDYLFNNSDVIVDHSKMTISFDNKVINITKDLFIPENFIINGQPGLTINLLNGASIYSKSAFNFNGSLTNPIKITSLDRLGGGLVIIGPKKKSKFINTIFEHLTSPNIGSSGLTASITIYDSNASFKSCIFKNNKSEDFLNLIRSEYELSDSYFKAVKSDAFDSDYSKGKIINTFFTDIGNDAMDFSGSISELLKINIDGVGDKAISVGEMSKVSGKYIDIINAEIGITSKDLSEVSLSFVKIIDTRLGFAVFQKKEEYGSAKAKIFDLEMKNVDFIHLVDLSSNLTLNGQDVITKSPKVEDLLYGKNFGKSSN